MKRLFLTAACAVALAGGAAPVMAAAPTPTPLPTTSAATATPAPKPSITMDQNTREVCTKSAETVTEGVTDFTTELGNVSTSATKGDLTAAEQSVKKAGVILVTLGDDLNTDAESAKNPKVKSTLEDVAKEFQSLGTSLTSLTSLQTFDTKHLEELADEMAGLCGSK